MDPKGYYKKFTVVRNETGEEETGFTFTLLLHDPHARVALLAYAGSCEQENPTLAAELREAVEAGTD